MSEEAYRVFSAISYPKNAHLFTVEAALKAFSHIRVDEPDDPLADSA